ncbi:MAG: hypothetical protein Tsb009_17280 [Planctomycetaceae bacterium]
MTWNGDLPMLNFTMLVAALLFATGAVGVIAHRNSFSAWMSCGVMLLACLLGTIGFSSFHADRSSREEWTWIILAGIAATVVSLVIGIVFGERFSRRDSPKSSPQKSQETNGESS